MGKFLIELSGSAKGCSIVPTVGRAYTVSVGDDYMVDSDLLYQAGINGFLSINSPHDLLINRIAFGMKTCIQLELPYPWSKHELTSNVAIKTYCRNGYLDSACHVIKLYFKSMFKYARR